MSVTQKLAGLSRRARTAIVGTAVMAVCVGASALTAPVAQAQTSNPYERGPAPTTQSVEARRGPYAIAEIKVGGKFGSYSGGTIYYPTTREDGTFGAVAISPGFLSFQSSVAWLGPRLASQGFVVMTIDTGTIFDQPAQRGKQLLDALDYLTKESAVKDRIDPNRLAVAGWSMGGGGSLEAAKDRPSLKAAIPMAGWNLNTNWSRLTTPVLVIGAENDLIAPVAMHSKPFYNSIRSEKAYLELDNGSHFTVTMDNTPQAKLMISWLKRWVDNDTRYEQFICPGPSRGGGVSDYRSTCPLSS